MENKRGKKLSGLLLTGLLSIVLLAGFYFSVNSDGQVNKGWPISGKQIEVADEVWPKVPPSWP